MRTRSVRGLDSFVFPRTPRCAIIDDETLEQIIDVRAISPVALTMLNTPPMDSNWLSEQSLETLFAMKCDRKPLRHLHLFRGAERTYATGGRDDNYSAQLLKSLFLRWYRMNVCVLLISRGATLGFLPVYDKVSRSEPT